ncbi:MAG: repeat-associated core domain protein [Planctomycetaceae bacterium]|nr:repeat-associated core domain protein [Planctomycetaceae bacterium]
MPGWFYCPDMKVPSSITLFTYGATMPLPKWDGRAISLSTDDDGKTWSSGTSPSNGVRAELSAPAGPIGLLIWLCQDPPTGGGSTEATCQNPLKGFWAPGISKECAGSDIDTVLNVFLDGVATTAAFPPVAPTVPCPICPDPACSAQPVNYATGELILEATDLSADGFGVPWGHTRKFASRLGVAQTLGHGFNWQVEEWRYLVITHDLVSVLGLPGGPLYFENTGAGYVGRYGIKQTLTLNAAANRFVMTDPQGGVTEFDAKYGGFRKFTAPGGNFIEVTSVSINMFNFTEVQRSHTEGSVTTIERFTYEYGDETGNQLLLRVTLSRKVGAGAWIDIQRASYTYYALGDSYGAESDLQSVSTESRQQDAWQPTGTTYYRYYIPSSSSSSSSSSGVPLPGPIRQHPLKFVLNPGAYARMVADGYTPETSSDSLLLAYADFFYEYDDQYRVISETVQSGSQTYSFDRTTSNFSNGFNRWKTRTVETLPDGNQNIVYSNYVAQPMLKIFKSGDDEWYEFWKFDSNGWIILHAHSAAISGYDDTKADLLNLVDGNYQYLRDYDGLIDLYTYHQPSGYKSAEMIRHGEKGDCFKLREYEYVPCCESSSSSSSSSAPSSSSPGGDCRWFLSKLTVYPEDGLSDGSSSSSSSSSSGSGCINDNTRTIITTYSYTFWSGTCAIQQKTTTLPVIPIEQNGSGIAATRREYFDILGNNTWIMDERGFLTRNTFDIAKGGIIQTIVDVDTSQVDNAPLGWMTPLDGGLHYITDYELDLQGRTIQSAGPAHKIDLGEGGVAKTIRWITWRVYLDATNQVWAGQGYQKVTDGTFVLANPVQISISDRQGRVLEQISAVRYAQDSSSSSSSSPSTDNPSSAPVYTPGKLTAEDTFPQTSYVAWQTTQYTDCCFVASRRSYHTIPLSGPGSIGTNYDEVDFGYDVMKRPIRSVTGGGTITRKVLDARGNATQTWVGTDDTGATPNDPTGGGASGNNMVEVSAVEYDNGMPGGDNNATQMTAFVDDTTSRVTLNLYDWRNRKTAIDGEIDYYQQNFYDNLDRQFRTDRRDTTAMGNLIARSVSNFDDQNRGFQSIRYAVNPETGVVGYGLTDNSWFDPSGNLIKSLPSGSKLFTKNSVDGAGRTTASYRGFDLSETNYADIFTVADDTILEQSEMVYDDASNMVQSRTHFRYHNATGTGGLGTPSSSEPKARVMYSAQWPDALGRGQASANYGTNGGTPLSRPDTIPNRSDSCLVTSMEFDAAGRQSTTTDPSGKVDKTNYDALGRRILTTANYLQLASSSSSSSSEDGCGPSNDENIKVAYAYNADGKLSVMIAFNSHSGNQTTQYVYGTTLEDSQLASSLLKREEIYPDSEDEDDVIRFSYNRQSETIKVTDQGGTAHEFDFDRLGRQIEDRVTSLGTDVGDAILRIKSVLEVRGMTQHLTSYSDATPVAGTIINDCLYVYNAFGQLVVEYQSHNGPVEIESTPKVGYAYADGSDNTTRKTQLIYPDGRRLNYDYGTAGGIDDAGSRVASLVDEGESTHLVGYSYLGQQTFVVVHYPEPQTQYTLVGTVGGNDPDTGDIYRGFDRFGRVKDSYWFNSEDSIDTDRIKYGYDRIGNRIWRENLVATADGAKFDELYEFDQLNRLKHMNRGTLNSAHTAMTVNSFKQCWTLDGTGNWFEFREDDTGDGTWDLIQARVTNSINEITDIAVMTGPTWLPPAYNLTGNMTTIPQSADPATTYSAVYDAWNRLIRLTDSTTSLTVSDYQYDGAKRRVTQVNYADGALDQLRHFFYTEPSQWQVIEERLGSDPESEAAERQFVLGLRYPDDCVMRDRDTDDDAALDERLYSLQDGNWNVTGLIDSTGTVQERLVYTAYGTPMTLSLQWLPQIDVYAWETLYAGYRYDIHSKVYHVRHRIYHSLLGNWIQRDPLRYTGSTNLYQYARSSPLRFLDAFGLLDDGVLPTGEPLWPMHRYEFPDGAWTADQIHLFLFDFYTGGDLGATGGVRPDYYSGVGEYIVLNGTILQDIANQPGRLEFATNVRDQLKGDAQLAFNTSKCAGQAAFSGSGSRLMQPIWDDPRATNLGLAFGKYYIYWDAKCTLSLVRGTVGCYVTWNCDIKWRFYDRYDFPWWLIPLSVLPGKSFDIIGSWTEKEGGNFKVDCPPCPKA